MMVRILIYCFEKGVSLLFFFFFWGGEGAKEDPDCLGKSLTRVRKTFPDELIFRSAMHLCRAPVAADCSGDGLASPTVCVLSSSRPVHPEGW